MRDGNGPETEKPGERSGRLREESRRPKMSRENRAKQFAPFAALAGLEAALLAKELETEAAKREVTEPSEEIP